MFDLIEKKAKAAALSIVLSSVGGLSLAAGMAFLTVAAWIFLTAVATPLTAALVIGGFYTGLGLIMMGLSSARSTKSVPDVRTHAPSEAPPLMQAFLHGVQAGANAQRR
ncbi:hypothetical protein BDE40_3095 [Litoreibacter halocynthiae]|uniref:Uncharacterized protein n=1 Tax=Litoreibacter halocynthiae TaxID=1242689 RepID=A0A4R7LF66_9RHOB|nr:phage holin family protein [Litoreibacter halocynthiae]TDT74298.1 hypothetical protein BDE40_3095 [Litoreibacter halocynthiae]